MTGLLQRLQRIRQRYIERGGQLLDAEQIAEEVQDRRGGMDENTWNDYEEALGDIENIKERSKP